MLKRKALFIIPILIFTLLVSSVIYYYNFKIVSFSTLLDKYYNNKIISCATIYRTDDKCQFIDINSNNRDTFDELFKYLNKFKIKPYDTCYDITDNTSYPKIYNIRILFEETTALNKNKNSTAVLSIYFRNNHHILLATDSDEFIIDDDNVNFNYIESLFKK